ncbi:hypothetical protein [Sphingobium fluviale]|uniref:Uncharacterized protein n=1 Tax=Sphingobium fluviale TaxID=2506423 RepID=A0A4Q1KKT3_9SPHN|nr:hypothetical protein [Sphingobium fluviale]RXR30501.1 hypothetical protein EQG66_04100 [Sphingobium fluviale]
MTEIFASAFISILNVVRLSGSDFWLTPVSLRRFYQPLSAMFVGVPLYQAEEGLCTRLAPTWHLPGQP